RTRAEQVPRLREAARQVRVEARAGRRLRAGARAGRDARAPARGRRGLEAEQGPDALDGLEVLALPDREHRPAVRERLVHGQVETVVAVLHLRAVKRAGAAFDPDAAARRALPGLVVDALLEEEQVDAAVRGRLERRAPAGRGTGVAAGLLLPALDGLGLLLAAPRLEQRLDQLEQLGRGRVGVRARPADDRLPRVVRERALELRSSLLGRDDDQLRPAQPTHLLVDVLGDFLQMVVDELLDVPLVARLRPAALVVAAGRVVGLLDDLLEPARAQAVEIAALAADEDHQRALAAPDQRDERREVEAAVDLDLVRN